MGTLFLRTEQELQIQPLNQQRGPRCHLEVQQAEKPLPQVDFLDSINQFMTVPLDSSQGVTVRHRRGLDYRDSQPSGFGSATWATAPLAGNWLLPSRPSEAAGSSEAEAWQILQASEEAWDSECEGYRQALRHMERDMEHLQTALVQARQATPAPGTGAATASAAPDGELREVFCRTLPHME
uniref:Uncharacterized protein n=1 Tax=Sphaerodactylus townsendi TaxID=933632 RepID=A0ACB8EMY7_9SAUR